MQRVAKGVLTLAALTCSLHTATAASAPVAAPPTDATALDAVQAARRVMMNDPAAALQIGLDLERRAPSAQTIRTRLLLLSKAKWIAGEASLRLNRIDEARRLIDASYELAKRARDRQSQGSALLSRGSIKSQGGDPAEALPDYLEAYQQFLATADVRSQSMVLQYLSQLYTDARDYKRAHVYLQQAVEAYQGEPMLQLSYANTMGNLLAEQRQFAKAEAEYSRALVIARKLAAHNLELLLCGNLASAQISQGHLSAASRTIDEAVSMARLTGIDVGNDLLKAKARLAFAQGKIQLAREVIAEVSAASARTHKPLDADTEFEAYKIYKAAGEFKPALTHLEVAGRLQRQALALGISTEASLMAARFDFATQDLRIAALTATALQREITLSQQDEARHRTIVIAVGLLVLAVLVTLSIWLATLRRSRNQFRAFNERLGESNYALEVALGEVKERAAAEDAARQLALHDALTGLPNRRFLSEEFQKSLQQGIDNGNGLALLLLDLDRFKPINDIYGHEIGDRVLIETANRIKLFCIDTDGTVVRLGGDEFLIVLPGERTDEEVGNIARAIITTIGAPIYIDQQRLTVGGSIGVARPSSSGNTIEENLRAADIAMYEAKRAGKNSYRLFDPAMKSRQRLRVA